jgi:excisionase family DNA binding protein
MRSKTQPDSRLLTPSEVAALFRVDPKTVTRWAQQGKLNAIRTLGGHRRYSESDIQAFLQGSCGLESDNGLARSGD